VSTRPRTGRTIRILGSAAAVAGVLLTSACGSGSASAKGASSPSPTSSAGRSRAAFESCLKKNGITLPSRTPGPRGSGFGQKYGGFGGMSPDQQKAFASCRSLLPGGGRFGGGGGFNSSAMQAYRTCLAAHGVTLPTARPTPGATPGPHRGLLGGLDTADPKVAAALRTCAPLRPTHAPAPGPGSGAAGS
jgi:hypothetical protein